MIALRILAYAVLTICYAFMVVFMLSTIPGVR